MNTYNINNKDFINSDLYKEFIKANPSEGYLKIRAYAASEALPISNLRIIVYTDYLDNRIILFEGTTDNSGVIEKIDLPTPLLDTDNLNKPRMITYNIRAVKEEDSIDLLYKANMYAGTCVVQNINIIPEIQVNRRGYYGN